MTDVTQEAAPPASAGLEVWPSLPFQSWQDTYATLHLWTQIIGKIRLRQMPWINHSWHAPLYVTPRGLTTSTVPHGSRTFEIIFDFLAHQLVIQADSGAEQALSLRPQTVADFYGELLRTLKEMDLPVTIHHRPNEVENPIPFEEDRVHASYDPEFANRHWRILTQVDRVFREFRSRFIGKNSPVHFFWGSFDLAVTRFSGRTAPRHPGGVTNLPDWVAREAYSHELSSAGFWAGGGAHPFPLFYSYGYPEPPGYSAAPVKPDAAFYSHDFKEFVLPYDAVREARDPDATLMEFLESTYLAAAELGGWDRSALEWTGEPPRGPPTPSGISHA
jgi:hypothetical protein